jgi:hypothetical protein
VAGDQHGATAPRLGAQQFAHPADPRRVEPVGGLVEDEDVGVAEQRRRDREALTHAHRVALHATVGCRREADLGEHLDAPIGVATRGASGRGYLRLRTAK